MASKYIKSKNITKPEKENKEEKSEKKVEYRSSVITPKRARELMLEEERKAAEEAETEIAEEAESAIPEAEPAESEEIIEETAIEEADEEEEKAERITYKGSSTDMFKNEGNTQEKEILYDIESAEVTRKSVRSRSLTRMIVCSAALTVVAIIIQFFDFHVPFTPRLFGIEFSAVPELIAAIAYGPVCGIIICLIKNIAYMFITPSGALSAASNFVLNSLFLLITSLLYARFMHNSNQKKRKKQKGERKLYSSVKVLLCSVIGAAISAIPQFFITRYALFPLYEKQYSSFFSMESILVDYQVSMEGLLRHLPEKLGALLPKITSVSMGIAVFNLPVTFGKLIVSSVIAALILKLSIFFLHNIEKR